MFNRTRDIGTRYAHEELFLPPSLPLSGPCAAVLPACRPRLAPAGKARAIRVGATRCPHALPGPSFCGSPLG